MPCRGRKKGYIEAVDDYIPYADDTTLIAMDEQEMSEFIERVERKSANFDLKLNRRKTKLMQINRNSKVGSRVK